MPLNFSTLFTPDTIPQEASLRQLLLYFETIFLYSPTEDIPPRLTDEIRPFLCHYAPVPFGETLPNFQRLIRDMTGHRAEYYGGGLSSISAQASSVDEESVWRLISQLSPQAANDPRHPALLQARLLLKLAEVRDREEEEIEQTLAQIEDKSQMMRQCLTEEDEEGRAEMPTLAAAGRQQSDEAIANRLRAWAHLFLADGRMADHWLISTSPAVLAILADHASKQMNEGPMQLLRLPLPGASIFSLAPETYLQERRAWRQETSACLAALAVGLKSAATTGVFTDSESISEQLALCHQKMPGWGAPPQATLNLYLLPVSLAELFAKIAKVPVHGAGKQALPYALVAVIQSAPLRSGLSPPAWESPSKP